MDIVYSTFFIQLAAFLILFLLLQKFAFKPLFGIMEKRKALVKEQLQTAEQNRTDAAKLLEEQKQAIQTARKEAYDMIEQAKVTSSRQADDIIRVAKEESARIKEEALKDIESEKNKAIATLRSQVSAMSVMIASKIIEKQLDEKSQQELINHYLNEVGGKA
ncbi:F0F1 ATP synthase subunit B [Paenibacillus ginsengarvi]|uniref:ATP synthase subunit b n=1 Tax=Paenibacillus ginsengarvi TaxID=400777 RepID=A0A3B0BZS4_9BACL|nr:F0F1 ATP synthase subunit B [Paenibacillus ginsengarvi]RKN78832.1 ATP synthase F0 subunit B [Paenibacillus ginsengarvi]